MAVVNEKDDLMSAVALRRRASSVSSSGCQSGEYFISKRATVKSSGACEPPLLVMIQPEGAVARVTRSRPLCAPRRKMLKTASPGVGDGACCAVADAAERIRTAAATAVQLKRSGIETG